MVGQLTRTHDSVRAAAARLIAHRKRQRETDVLVVDESVLDGGRDPQAVPKELWRLVDVLAAK